MGKRLLAVLSLVCGLAATGEAQSQWSPPGLLFRPLQANVFEGRVGVLYQPVRDKLRLDIGTTIDLRADSLSDKVELRSGADFFTFTRLRSEGRFKFPVETADFFFGVNSTLRLRGDAYDVTGRLRIAHISSHLVDGYAGPVEAFTYSREFVDLVAALELNSLRLYAGVNWLFSTIPDDFGTLIPQLGFDFAYGDLIGSHLSLVGGYDFKLPTINDATTAVHAGQIGLKVGERYAAGISVNFSFYRGKSVHGMFFNDRDSYAALGVQVEY